MIQICLIHVIFISHELYFPNFFSIGFVMVKMLCYNGWETNNNHIPGWGHQISCPSQYAWFYFC
jgi:hypothetical protein